MPGKKVPQKEPLHRYPVIATSDPDEFRGYLRPLYSITSVSLPNRGRDFLGRLNHRQMTSMGITFAQYGDDIRVTLSQGEAFIQGFPLSGSGRALWNRAEFQVSPQQFGIIGNPGSGGTLEYEAGFQHVALRFNPHALLRLLAAVTDCRSELPLRFLNEGSFNPDYGRVQFRLIQFLLRELDSDDPFPPLVMQEMEQAIMLSFLHANENTYSRYLRNEPPPAARWQARRAAEYIEAHWDGPITVEALASICNLSSRSLYQIFRQTYGVSPMTFVRNIRLARARDMLRAGGPEMTVTSISYLCGFSNAGRFAREYAAAFGELPSQTLRGRS